MQYLLYDQMKVVPEEISILMVEAPLPNKLKRANTNRLSNSNN
jgi:hypothetical protein